MALLRENPDPTDEEIPVSYTHLDVYKRQSLDASRKIYEARMCLTEFFGGDDAARLVFTANATEALNIASRARRRRPRSA